MPSVRGRSGGPSHRSRVATLVTYSPGEIDGIYLRFPTPFDAPLRYRGRSSLMYNPPMSSAGRLVVHHRSGGAAIGSVDGFFLMRCFGDIRPEDIRATLLGFEAVVAYRPEGGCSIVAVDSTTTFPSEETRRTAVGITRKTGNQTLAETLVILGDGFWASAMRGVMTTIWSLTSSTHPRKVLRQEADAVDWVIQTVQESAPKYRQVLLSALVQLRADATIPPTVLSSSSKTSP